MLSIALCRLARRFCMTKQTGRLPCWVERAAYTTSGTGVAGGSERPSAQSMRIVVRRPMWDVDFHLDVLASVWWIAVVRLYQWKG